MTELNYQKDSKEQMPYQHYLELFADSNPLEISERLAITYEEESQTFCLRFLGTVYRIVWPEFTITHEDNSYGYYPLEEMIYAKILVLRYLTEGKKVRHNGEFRTFRELPWGELYQRQFDGRCIKRLAFGFGNKPEQFKKVMELWGALPLSFGDASYELELFDGYFVRFIIWEGDDEFPPSSQILFSENFGEGLHGEDRVVTGDVCIGTMKALASKLM